MCRVPMGIMCDKRQNRNKIKTKGKVPSSVNSRVKSTNQPSLPRKNAVNPHRPVRAMVDYKVLKAILNSYCFSL